MHLKYFPNVTLMLQPNIISKFHRFKKVHKVECSEQNCLAIVCTVYSTCLFVRVDLIFM